MESEQKKEKKYLGVYGQGLTYVVGNVVPAWRNISAGKDKPAWTLEHPEDKENWARNLVLIDVTGGMNVISPYPERRDATNPYIRRKIKNKMEELKKLEFDGKKFKKLHVLRHISGTEHDVVPLKEAIDIPEISQQLEIGRKFGVFNKLPPARPGWNPRWTLAENVTRRPEALPAGIGATKNIGNPVVPMLVTGYETVKIQDGSEIFKLTAVNPLDLEKEEFLLKGVQVNDNNRELLANLKLSFRMFEPSRYIKGKLSVARLVGENDRADNWKQKQENKANKELLGNLYETAVKKARYIEEQEEKYGKGSYRAYLSLADTCQNLFLTKGFFATLGHSVEVTRGTEMGKRLAAVYDKIEDGIYADHVSLNSRSMRKVMLEMAAYWDNNMHLAPGNFDYVKQMDRDLSVASDARCSALLAGICKIMGDSVYLDRQRGGVYMRLSTDAHGQPIMAFPKEYSGEKLIEAVCEKLNKVRNSTPAEMYMSTRNALTIISPFMTEDQKETLDRLGQMIADGIDRYMTPGERGLVLIPTYRSGYIRTYQNGISVNVRPTIADAWVTPETMNRYVNGLKDWMKRNGMDVPVVIETKGGMEAAELTRHVLKTRCGIDDAKKIALLEKIKDEIAEEINLRKKTDLSKTPKERKGSNAKNKNDILR